MTESPYSPALSRGETATQPFRGAYHENGYLVVSSTACQLPSVCLKTGVNTKDHFQLDDRFLPKSTRIWASLLGGAIGYSIAKKNWGRPVRLALPLSKDWMEKTSRESKFSWIVVCVGVAFLFLGLILSVFHGIFAMLGLAGAIVALVTAYLKGRKKDSPFTVSNIRDDWVWIGGVMPEVATRFPPLPPGGPRTP